MQKCKRQNTKPRNFLSEPRHYENVSDYSDNKASNPSSIHIKQEEEEIEQVDSESYGCSSDGEDLKIKKHRISVQKNLPSDQSVIYLDSENESEGESNDWQKAAETLGKTFPPYQLE